MQIWSRRSCRIGTSEPFPDDVDEIGIQKETEVRQDGKYAVGQIRSISIVHMINAPVSKRQLQFQNVSGLTSLLSPNFDCNQR
jgi:hypothetical protein